MEVVEGIRRHVPLRLLVPDDDVDAPGGDGLGEPHQPLALPESGLQPHQRQLRERYAPVPQRKHDKLRRLLWLGWVRQNDAELALHYVVGDPRQQPVAGRTARAAPARRRAVSTCRQ